MGTGKPNLNSFFKELGARIAGNGLRDTISDAVRDGVLTPAEKQEISLAHFALSTALKNVGDDVSLPAETSPWFGSDPAIDETNRNLGSARAVGYPSLARPGFELNGLDVVTEDGANAAININLSEAIANIASSNAIPDTAQSLISVIEQALSEPSRATNSLVDIINSARDWTHPKSDGPGDGSGRGNDDDDSGSGAGATGGDAITTGNELSVDAGIVAPVANPPGTWSGGGTGTPDPGLPINPDYVGIQPIILDLDGDGVEGNAANGGWAREAPRLAA